MSDATPAPVEQVATPPSQPVQQGPSLQPGQEGVLTELGHVTTPDAERAKEGLPPVGDMFAEIKQVSADLLKPGWRTTEWWTTLGTDALGVAGLVWPTGHANSVAVAVVRTASVVGPVVATAVYTLGRTRLKLKA